MGKSEESYAAWEKTLPSRLCGASDLQPSISEEQSAFEAWAGSLPSSLGEDVAACDPEPPPPPPPPADRLELWLLIECHDGEPPRLRSFPTRVELAARLVELDGEDVFVIPVLGELLKVSQGPRRRYLITREGAVSSTALGVFELDADETAELDVQEDGYLGPVEMGVMDPPAPTKKSRTPPPRRKFDDDEEDEDEDDT
jgi:hypothetical protein